MHKYTHLELNEDVQSTAGYYTPLKEVRLKYNNREVLYVVGQNVMTSACGHVGSYGHILVPGYIINWQQEQNKAVLSVSEVEPITDKAIQDNIRRILKETEHILQIEFW